MKISSINNTKELHEVIDNWRDRAEKLHKVMKDENCPSNKRHKAQILWVIIADRISTLQFAALKVKMLEVSRYMEKYLGGGIKHNNR